MNQQIIYKHIPARMSSPSRSPASPPAPQSRKGILGAPRDLASAHGRRSRVALETTQTGS